MNSAAPPAHEDYALRPVSGETQFIGVVGEAGVGKSRLCIELVARSGPDES